MAVIDRSGMPANQDQLLPADVSMRSSTWFDRSSSYPIFSSTWYRYRVISSLFYLVTLGIIFFLIGFAAKKSWKVLVFTGGSIEIGLVFLLLSGIGLAVLVRRQAWPVRKEAIGLVAALLLGLLLTCGAFYGGKYLIKHALNTNSVHLYFSGSLEEESAANADGKVLGSQSAPQPKADADSMVHTMASDMMNDDPPSLDTMITVLSTLAAVLFTLRFGGGKDLWMFFRQRRKLEEALLQQEVERVNAARNEAELRLSVLMAQIEPHFLFNTLAGVRSAVVSEPQRATAIVDHLVEYLRATIPQLRSDGSSAQARLGAQLEAARAYLALMRARMPRLNYSVEADPDLLRASMPPLMLISLVENAVKHGIESKVGSARIDVHARQVRHNGADAMELSVRDDGIGFNGATAGSGIGLSNIRERLAALYGDRANLTLKALPGGGVDAIILLPLSISPL